MKNINTLLNISLIFLLSFIFSCDDDIESHTDSESVECDYCFEEKPEYVDLELIFNVEQSNKRVKFTIYSGFAFASEVFMTGETYEDSLWVSVLPDQEYSVVAEYAQGEKLIHVINDCKVKTEYFKYACDEPCHYVYEASCDLKIKK